MSGLIRSARERAGVSVRELARRGDVKPATVQSWERSEEAGTIQLSTLVRALDALHERLLITTEPRYPRREQRLGYEFHRLVLEKLRSDPDRVLASAAERLPRVRAGVSGDLADEWMGEWQTMIDERDFDGLAAVITGSDQRSIDMRQVSPFDTVLSQAERASVLERAR